MSKITVVIVILFSSIHSFGQSEAEEHIIDIQLKACLDSTENQTTYGMTMCAIIAHDAWDIELNKYYKLLLTILSADEKEKLKTVQRNWIAYRDSEILFAETMYDNLLGTMWKIVSADRQAEITKQRALALKEYYQNLM